MEEIIFRKKGFSKRLKRVNINLEETDAIKSFLNGRKLCRFELVKIKGVAEQIEYNGGNIIRRTKDTIKIVAKAPEGSEMIILNDDMACCVIKELPLNSQSFPKLHIPLSENINEIKFCFNCGYRLKSKLYCEKCHTNQIEN
jgi:hypothetical protein